MKTILAAVGTGLAGARRSPGLVSFLWLTALILALPLTVAMEEAIRTDVGASAVQQDLLQAIDLGWLEEFQFRGGVLSSLLTPGRVSRVLPLENIELWLSGRWLTEHRQLAATGLVFILLWILLQGGVLCHLHRSRSEFSVRLLLAEGSLFFFRFLRLAAITGLAYYGLYRLAYWLFPAIVRWSRDVTVERTVLLWNLAAALGFALLLCLVHLVADFARIATIRSDRRSMVLAVGHALRMVLRHPAQAFGTLLTVSALLLLAQIAWFVALPDPGGGGILPLVLALLLGQVYLWVRWALRITRFGAEIALYRQWSGQ